MVKGKVNTTDSGRMGRNVLRAALGKHDPGCRHQRSDRQQDAGTPAQIRFVARFTHYPLKCMPMPDTCVGRWGNQSVSSPARSGGDSLA